MVKANRWSTYYCESIAYYTGRLEFMRMLIAAIAVIPSISRRSCAINYVAMYIPFSP